MTTQSFRRIKIDINDTLYSQIIRFQKNSPWIEGYGRCRRCHLVRKLQCAHIVGRGAYSTRFQLKPIPNAVPLCADCHDWMDRRKDNTPLFNEGARLWYTVDQNAYMWLNKIGFKWRDLQLLYLAGQQRPKIHYKYWKKEMTKNLRQHIKKLEE